MNSIDIYLLWTCILLKVYVEVRQQLLKFQNPLKYDYSQPHFGHFLLNNSAFIFSLNFIYHLFQVDFQQFPISFLQAN